MSATLDQKLDTAAQGIAILAKDAGAAIGVTKGTEAVRVLERALAIAWCDVLMFQGADSDARFALVVDSVRERVVGNLHAQRILRRGHKPI
jgi:hypothetical protein